VRSIKQNSNDGTHAIYDFFLSSIMARQIPDRQSGWRAIATSLPLQKKSASRSGEASSHPCDRQLPFFNPETAADMDFGDLICYPHDQSPSQKPGERDDFAVVSATWASRPSQ
jgi:hypothetical protein